jgi:hypothetical protein
VVGRVEDVCVEPLEDFCPGHEVGVAKRSIEDFGIGFGSCRGVLVSAVGFESWGREVE